MADWAARASVPISRWRSPRAHSSMSAATAGYRSVSMTMNASRSTMSPTAALLRGGEIGRIFHHTTVRRGGELAKPFQFLFVGPENPQVLRRGPAGVEPSPPRPVGELAGGHRDGFGQLRQPPLVRRELVGVFPLVRQ